MTDSKDKIVRTVATTLNIKDLTLILTAIAAIATPYITHNSKVATLESQVTNLTKVVDRQTREIKDLEKYATELSRENIRLHIRFNYIEKNNDKKTN